MKNIPQCTKCWDKGYSSELCLEIGYPDFIGDAGYQEQVERKNYCTCLAGQAIKKRDEKNKRIITKNYMKKESEIYKELRLFHSLVKDWLDYDDTSEEQKNALEGLHSVLYMVEKEFIDF